MDAFLSGYINRRRFLKDAGIMAALAAVLGTGACEALCNKIRNRPMRRYIRSGNADAEAALELYRQAVAAMRALDTSNPGDPRGWTRQAQIHQSYCPHGNWAFLPWHRAYLFYFEKICQGLLNNPDFGLPYWNWAIGQSIPAPFQDNASTLYDGSRINSNVNALLAGHDNMETIMSNSGFEAFASGPASQGQLEGGPHNHVHSTINGNMGGYMSPLDPIFWTHHCMIDYCWVDWNINRGNDNTNDPAWTGLDFGGQFYDANGDSVGSGITTVTTLLMPFLSYQYEPSQIGTSVEDAFARSASEIKQLQKKVEAGAALRLAEKRRLPLLRGARLNLEQAFALPPEAKAADFSRVLEEDADARALLSVGLARFPAESDFFVRVFVNLPDARPDTPISHPSYAGSFAFFGEEGHDPATYRYLVDLTEALRRLRERGELDAERPLEVRLVAVPNRTDMPGPAIIEIEDISLTLSEIEAFER